MKKNDNIVDIINGEITDNKVINKCVKKLIKLTAPHLDENLNLCHNNFEALSEEGKTKLLKDISISIQMLRIELLDANFDLGDKKIEDSKVMEAFTAKDGKLNVDKLVTGDLEESIAYISVVLGLMMTVDAHI
jgi:hypothetical protein